MYDIVDAPRDGIALVGEDSLEKQQARCVEKAGSSTVQYRCPQYCL